MKWFKHFSDASNDEFISDLEDELGLVGYARWWKLLETIAAQMESGNSKCSASYSEKKWCRKLQCKPKVLHRFLECTNNAGKTKAVQDGNIIEIFCAKLLELRDNHSRNLQVTTKPLAPDLLLEVEVEEEEPTPPPPKYKGDFAAIWKRYPNKAGKSSAEKRFDKSVNCVQAEEEIHHALDNYLKHLAKETWKKPQNGSTWFNSWQDWVDFEDNSDYGEELTPQQKQILATGTAY